MILEVTKILKNHQSNNGNIFTVVYFRNPADGKFYMTYLCPDYRNWTNWEKFLRKGKLIKNLHIRQGNIIDADCLPGVVGKREKELFLESVKRSKMGPEELRQYYQRIGIFI